MPDRDRLAVLAKALGHPARVQIIDLLSRQAQCRGAEVFSELPLAQSTISEHLRVLREAGLVSSTPTGTGARYCLAPDALEDLASAIAEFAGRSRDCSMEGVCR